MLGAFTRATGFSPQADVQSVDAFATGAAGSGIFDGVAAVHYLKSLESASLPGWAATGALGAFLDLADDPPAPVMGLSLGFGEYHYRELHEVFPDAPNLLLSPRVRRYDVVLSFSGAPSKGEKPVAGIGFRFSRVQPNLLPAKNSLQVMFSSNFKATQ